MKNVNYRNFLLFVLPAAALLYLVYLFGAPDITGAKNINASPKTPAEPISTSSPDAAVNSKNEEENPWAEFDRCLKEANSKSPFGKENPCFGGMSTDEVLSLSSDPETNRYIQNLKDPNAVLVYQGNIKGAIAAISSWTKCKPFESDSAAERSCIELADAMPHARTLLEKGVQEGDPNAAYALATDVDWQLRRMQRHNSLWDTYYNRAIQLYTSAGDDNPEARQKVFQLKEYAKSQQGTVETP
jgi:hypothetical protein